MSTKKYRRNVLETVQEWYKKISFIEHQINSLEEIRDIPLISISVFLLKAQYIEFQLKQLITSLDQHIFFSSTSSLVKAQVRNPKKLEDDGVKMLGQILKELKKYKGDLLITLVSYLADLNKARIKFTHKLYDPEGTIKQLHKEAENGINLANRTLQEIRNIEMELKNNDPLDFKT